MCGSFSCAAVQVAITWASNVVANESVWRWLSKDGQCPVERDRVLTGEQEGLIFYMARHENKRLVTRGWWTEETRS